MIHMLAELAIAISSSLVLSLTAQATVVSAGALVAVHIARGSRAAVRHLLLATAFVILLMLPLVSVSVPARELGVPVRQVRPAAAVATLAPVDVARLASRSVGSGGLPTGPVTTTLPSTWMLWVAVWFTGVMSVLRPMIVGLVYVRRLRRDGLPWHEGQAVVTEISTASAVRTRVQLLVHDAVAGPLTCGVVRPAIILPRDASTWDPEQLRRAIVHELEHIRRADWLMLCVARVVCALYWFHPLVWTAWRRLRLEAERACDDAVVEGAPADAYADQLVTLAERLASTRAPSVLAMANGGDLSIRISALLNDQQARGRAGSLWIAAASGSALVLVGGLAPLRAVPVSQVIMPREASRMLGASSAVDSPAIGSNPASVRSAVQTSIGEERVSDRSALEAPPRSVPERQEERPTFEVASIRPNNTDAEPSLSVPPRGAVVVRNIPLRNLIVNAYGVPAFRVVGGPDWIRRERFDITATVPDGAVAGQPRLMLQALLEERFKLRVHRETREQEVYALVVAREDGQLGPALRRSSADCAPEANANPLAVSPDSPCGGLFGVGSAGGTIVSNGQPLTRLVSALGMAVSRTVVDRTGLEGAFDLQLKWSADVNTSAVTGDAAPSMFTALQEQLGLKLEPGRGPVDMLVIDDVERPTPD